MTIERARPHAVTKPWGRRELAPWSPIDHAGRPIGEIWFERTTAAAKPTELLLKLLFTCEPLSIQVHPDDVMARAMGLPHGKTEAWYVLEAEPDAAVALGPLHELTREGLRAAISDGSIVDLTARRVVRPGDVVFVPAGTIHAIGPGLVVAEIQQRSDTTFRLFDYGRDRALHIEAGVAAATLLPAPPATAPRAVAEGRMLLVSHPLFALERLDLGARTRWDLAVTGESWLLVIDGALRVGPLHVTRGEAVFLEDAAAELVAGRDGARLLLAHSGAEPIPRLSHRDGHIAGTPVPEMEGQS